MPCSDARSVATTVSSRAGAATIVVAADEEGASRRRSCEGFGHNGFPERRQSSRADDMEVLITTRH